MVGVVVAAGRGTSRHRDISSTSIVIDPPVGVGAVTVVSVTLLGVAGALESDVSLANTEPGLVLPAPRIKLSGVATGNTHVGGVLAPPRLPRT